MRVQAKGVHSKKKKLEGYRLLTVKLKLKINMMIGVGMDQALAACYSLIAVCMRHQLNFDIHVLWQITALHSATR